MSLRSFINQEQYDYLQTCEVVVVIGLPASGKTTVAQWLQEAPLVGHSLYSSDDFIDYGYEQSLYKMIEAMEADPNPRKIVEGVQGFRFLRKNAKTRAFKVDCLVVVEATQKARLERYAERGKRLSTPFDRNLETVFAGYLAEMAATEQDLPKVINVRT